MPRSQVGKPLLPDRQLGSAARGFLHPLDSKLKLNKRAEDTAQH